jgi:hypothetical protein
MDDSEYNFYNNGDRHYIDSTFKNCTKLIALKSFYKNHSGENMAAILI